MSTRRLILLAMACGLAILVAGSIQLFRLTRTDTTVEVGSVGTEATVDGVAVTLVEQPAADQVVVRMSVPDDRDPLTDPSAPWAVRVGGQPFPAVPTVFDGVPPGCTEIGPIGAGESAECRMAFAPAGEGTPYLQFTLRGKTALWALDA